MHVEVIVVINIMDCITFSHITFPFIRPLKIKRPNMTFILGCFMQYLVPFNLLFILFSQFNKPHVELLYRLYNSHPWYSVFRWTSIYPLDFLWIRHLAASFTSLKLCISRLTCPHNLRHVHLLWCISHKCRIQLIHTHSLFNAAFSLPTCLPDTEHLACALDQLWSLPYSTLKYVLSNNLI